MKPINNYGPVKHFKSAERQSPYNLRSTSIQQKNILPLVPVQATWKSVETWAKAESPFVLKIYLVGLGGIGVKEKLRSLAARLLEGLEAIEGKGALQALADKPRTLEWFQEVAQRLDGHKKEALKTAWPQIRSELLKAEVRDIPPLDDSIDTLRAYFRNPAHQRELEKIESLILSHLNLKCLPLELTLMPNLREMELNSCNLNLCSVTFRGLGHLTSLIVSETNEANTIQIGAFDPLKNLTYLMIDCYPIPLLSRGLLANQGSLQTFEMCANDMKEIEEGALDSLVCLKTLSIQGNKLITLPEAVLRKLSCLEKLDLSENDIKDLPVSLTEGLKRLETVYVEENNLQDLNFLRGCASLKVLEASSNKIENVEGLTGKRELTAVHLAGNKISSLSDALFEHASNLDYLDLSNNSFMDTSAFKQALQPLQGLKHLILQDMEFPAEQLQAFFEHLEKLKSIQVNGGKFTRLGFQAYDAPSEEEENESQSSSLDDADSIDTEVASLPNAEVLSVGLQREIR